MSESIVLATILLRVGMVATLLRVGMVATLLRVGMVATGATGDIDVGTEGR